MRDIVLKTCAKCGIDKKLEDFGVRRNVPSGRKSRCKKCTNEDNKGVWDSYCKKNKKILKEKWKAYRTANREKRLLSWKEWELKNKESRKEYVKKYKKENMSRVLSWNNKRRAIKKNAFPIWANLEAIDNFYAKARELNLTRPEEGPWHVDHIIPLQGKNVVGLHVEYNMQVIPASVNCAKNNHFKEGGI